MTRKRAPVYVPSEYGSPLPLFLCDIHYTCKYIKRAERGLLRVNAVVDDTEEPVKITLEMKNVEGFESESATLTCDLSKAGRTDGQWLFNEQPLTTSERVQLKVDGYHQSIEFAELTIADAGQYTYRIENVSTSATLTVRGTTFEPVGLIDRIR